MADRTHPEVPKGWTRQGSIDWVSFLAAVSQLTVEDIAREVAHLPEELRGKLTPHPGHYDCGVCNAFGAAFYTGDDFTLDDPRWVVDMRCARDQWYGAFATEVFDRCSVIYDMAGSEMLEAVRG